MSLSLADVPRGWKVYVLAWLWLGILVGGLSESAAAAAITWAVGASAGWLLAPTIAQRGWRALAPFALGATLFVGVLFAVATLASQDFKDWPRNWAGALVGMIWAFALGVRLLSPSLASTVERLLNSPIGSRAPDAAATRYRCPRCNKPSAFRRADRMLRCETCGHVFSSSGKIHDREKIDSAQQDVEDRKRTRPKDSGNTLRRDNHEAVTQAPSGMELIQHQLESEPQPRGEHATVADPAQPEEDDNSCSQCGQLAPWSWDDRVFGLACWRCGTMFAGPFIGHKATRIYHQIHCEKLMKIMPGQVVPIAAIDDAVRQRYRPCESCAARLKPEPMDDAEDLDLKPEALDAHGELGPTVKLVNVIIRTALEKGATEIHFEPEDTVLRVRYRIDGVLYDIMQPPIKFRDAITSRLKVMSRLDVSSRDVLQHGRMKIVLRNLCETQEADIFVSSHPTPLGERILAVIVPDSTTPM